MPLDLLASIPSPSNSVIHLGPVPLHVYGLMIAIAVLVAVKIGEVRWVKRGHDAKEYGDVVIWLVIGGVIGARLYHVVTDYQLFQHDPLRIFRIWEGGLAIWGAIAGGVLVAVVMTRRRHLDLADLLDCAAPALAFAQAIGRWGNWFNQELFGGPSTLPWAIQIDPAHRPREFAEYSTFQPTFLYESLWCAALGFALLWIDKRFTLAKGQLFALYCAGYTVFRFWMEMMRVDEAHEIGPLRVNGWVSIVVFVGAVAAFVLLGRKDQMRDADSAP